MSRHVRAGLLSLVFTTLVISAVRVVALLNWSGRTCRSPGPPVVSGSAFRPAAALVQVISTLYLPPPSPWGAHSGATSSAIRVTCSSTMRGIPAMSPWTSNRSPPTVPASTVRPAAWTG